MPAGKAYGGRKNMQSAPKRAKQPLTPRGTGGGKQSLIVIDSSMPAGKRKGWPYQ